MSQNGNYRQMPPEYYSGTEDSSPVSTGEWILTLFITGIPCIGIIFLIFWAVDQTQNKNIRSYCRAQLIFRAFTVLTIIFWLFFFIFVSDKRIAYY